MSKRTIATLWPEDVKRTGVGTITFPGWLSRDEVASFLAEHHDARPQTVRHVITGGDDR